MATGLTNYRTVRHLLAICVVFSLVVSCIVYVHFLQGASTSLTVSVKGLATQINGSRFVEGRDAKHNHRNKVVNPKIADFENTATIEDDTNAIRSSRNNDLNNSTTDADIKTLRIGKRRPRHRKLSRKKQDENTQAENENRTTNSPVKSRPDLLLRRALANITNAIRRKAVMSAESTLSNTTSAEITLLLKHYEEGFDDSHISRNNTWGIPPSKIHRRRKGDGDGGDAGRKLVCMLQRHAMLVTLDTDVTPFKELGVAQYFPNMRFLDAYKTPFNRCAVVGSSRYLNNFTVGSEIDAHDAVMRINAAPVKGYEEIVGNKTTFHLLNSQLLEGRLFRQIKETYYGNVTHIVWKGGPYSGNLYRWYKKARSARRFFSGYIEWNYLYPAEAMHVINPKSLWNAWDVMQDHCHQHSGLNPPSSGFTAIQVMLPICTEVNVYGMIYPEFNSSTCHYYDSKRCNSLNWHPISKEKCFIRKLNVGNETDIYEHAKITIPGYPAINCVDIL